MKKNVIISLVFVLLFSSVILAETYEKELPVKNYWEISKKDLTNQAKETNWIKVYNNYRKNTDLKIISNFKSYELSFYTAELVWLEIYSTTYKNMNNIKEAKEIYEHDVEHIKNNLVFLLDIKNKDKDAVKFKNMKIIYKDNLGNKKSVKSNNVKVLHEKKIENLITIYQNFITFYIPINFNPSKLEYIEMYIIPDDRMARYEFKFNFKKSNDKK